MSSITWSGNGGSGSIVRIPPIMPLLNKPSGTPLRGTAPGSKGSAVTLPNEPAERDAPVVARIRRQGCVVVGKTNLHEFAFGVTSANPHYGAVRNPHDPTRVAGGSSGGSAVAVAAGMCDWAIGSDTVGSIRIPASVCGVVGFKPAFDSIDIGGVVPLAWSLDTLGPLGPDVKAVARAFSMMSGEAATDESLERPRIGIPRGWIAGTDEPTERSRRP